MLDNRHEGETHMDDGGKGVSRRTVIGAAGSLSLAAAALTAGVPASAEAQSPEGCFFALEIADFFTGHFQEVRGIGSETIVREGGRPMHKWPPIELKRGVDRDMSLYEWRKMVEAGNIGEARKNGSIVIYDQTHAEVARWNFTNAWPSKLESGGSDQSFHSQTGSPSCVWEAVTLTVESVTRLR